METGLLHTHSFLRWVILLLLLVAVFRHLTAGDRVFNLTDRRVGLFLLISADLMLAIGIYQWAFGKTWGLISLKERGFREVMRDDAARFFAVEHFVGMIVAIIMIHIGRSYAKRTIPDSLKHKRSLLFYGLALLIILVFIPWPFRQVGAGRGWF